MGAAMEVVLHALLAQVLAHVALRYPPPRIYSGKYKEFFFWQKICLRYVLPTGEVLAGLVR